MPTIDETIAAAKSSLSPIKAQVSEDIAASKASTLRRDLFSDAVSRARQQFDVGKPDPKAIISDENNIIQRADGTIDIRGFDGGIIENVNPNSINELLAIEQQKFKDAEAGVSKNPLIDSTLGLLNIGAKIAGDLTTSAVKTASDYFEVGTSSQTLNEEVRAHNILAEAAQYRKNLPSYKKSSRNIPEIISNNAVIDFNGIIKSLENEEALTPAQKGFTKTSTFKTLVSLKSKVANSAKTFDAIDNATKAVQSIVPTSRTDDLVTSLAFKRIAETQGTVAAIKSTILNDMGQLVKQGFENLPYMVAFTVGGPVAQSSILVGLSRAKAAETTQAFIDEHGREPTNVEQTRINIWSTTSTIFEKFGDMVAVGSLTKASFPRINNIHKIAESLLPSSVKLIAKPVVGLGGEGLSGALTATSDQLAASGKITDPSQIAFDALAEAAGTPGAIAGMAAGQATFNIAKQASEAVKNRSKRKDQLRANLANTDAKLENFDNEEFTAGDSPLNNEKVARFRQLQDLDNIKEATANAKLDLNGNIEINNEAVKDLFDDLISKEFTPADALAEVKKIVADNLAKTADEKTQLEKELSAPANEEEIAAIKSELENFRKNQQDRLDGKPQNIPVSQQANTSEISEEAFNTELERLSAIKIDLNDQESIDDVIESLGNLKQRKLKRDQLNRFIRFEDSITKEISEKEGNPIEDKDSDAAVVGSLQPEDIEKVKNAELTDPADIKQQENLILANDQETALEAELGPKTQAQVNKDIEEGATDQFTGFKTYLKIIEDIFKDKDKSDSAKAKAIESARTGLATHLQNMKDKRDAFVEALERFEDGETNLVVKGSRVETGRNASRAMNYEIVTLKEGEEVLANGFNFKISKKSRGVIAQIGREVALGETQKALANNFESTSVFRNTKQRRSNNKRNTENLKALRDTADNAEIVETFGDNIVDPVESTSKKTEVKKIEEEVISTIPPIKFEEDTAKTPAEKFTKPSIEDKIKELVDSFVSTTDPNWQQKDFILSPTSKTTAGAQMRALYKELQQIDQLLECLG